MRVIDCASLPRLSFFLGAMPPIPHDVLLFARLKFPPLSSFLFPPSTSSFFQSLCILGYCVFPLDIAALANLLVGLAFESVIVKALIVALGFAWATRGTERRERKENYMSFVE